MKLFPESAAVQLEFDKIKALLHEQCKSEYGKSRASDLRIHTLKEYIELELQQSHEYKLLLQNAHFFPNDFTLNLSREIKLLGIPGAMLGGDQFVQLRQLVDSIQQVFRWFDSDRKIAYPALARVIANTHYEK